MPAIAAPLPPDEPARLAVLRALEILDTPPEPAYDDIVALAAQIACTPIALVSLVDAERQWVKAWIGLDAGETHRDIGFCTHAIVAAEPVFIVPDALLDPRFADNPLVTGGPRIRFYAGAPIVTAEGRALGTVCVVDTSPRRLDASQQRALRALARQTAALFELRRSSLVADERARAFEALSLQAAHDRRRSAETLQLVLRAGDLGQWDLFLPSGRFSADDRERALLGYSRDEIADPSMTWRRLIHPDDVAAAEQAAAPHLRGEVGFYHSEHRMRHRDGRWIWVRSHATIVERDASGAPLRILGTHIDVTGQRQSRIALQDAGELLQRMGQLAEIGGWKLELATGQITWTDEVYRIHEIGTDAPLDLVRSLDFYTPEARPLIQAAFERAASDGTPYDLELGFVSASGRRLTVRAQGEAVLEAGRPVRLVGTFQDITERRRTEAALRLSERRLKLAVSRPGLAVFDWDCAADRVYRGSSLAVMRGALAEEQVCDIAEVQSLIHPADLLSARAAMLSAIGGRSEGYDHEYRIRRVDGGWAWIHAVGRVVERDADGRALRVSGTEEDVTAQRATAHALLESQRRLRIIADNVPALIAHIDTEERYRYVNAQNQHLLGMDVESAIGRQVREVRGEAVYATLAPYIRDALDGTQVTFVHTDGTGDAARHYRTEFVPDSDASGVVQGFYSLAVDITELQQTQHRLEHLASVDSLTGLPNRRFFEQRMTEAMARTRRTGVSMSVMFLDIDHFKKINDGWGHAGGDAVLCEFARRLKSCVRATDMAARLAGDEFVLLLENIESTGDLNHLAAKVVDCIRMPFEIDEVRLKVTTSVGVSVYDGASESAFDMLALADDALYSAKQMGRDRVAFGD